MNSLQHLSKLGYNVVAIDLPGYGESPKASVDPASYLEVVIKRLKLKKPVIVSPSMSGRFSLPFLFKEPIVDRCRGFVPVAPVGTGKYTKDQYENLEVPTLFIRGTEDTSYGLNSQEDLQQLPNFKLKEYEGAGHPAYLHNPERFHKDLDTFFKELLATKE